MKIRSYSIPYFTLASNIIAEEENELREIFLPISHVHETSFNENDDLVEKEDFDSDEISIRSESDKNGGKDKVPDGLEKSDSTINREVISTSYSKENRNHVRIDSIIVLDFVSIFSLFNIIVCFLKLAFIKFTCFS